MILTSHLSWPDFVPYSSGKNTKELTKNTRRETRVTNIGEHLGFDRKLKHMHRGKKNPTKLYIQRIQRLKDQSKASNKLKTIRK